MSGHALLSPSSAVRWMHCPGSVRLSKDLPDVSSKFADEGTDAHEIAALALTNGFDAKVHIGYKLKMGKILDDEMAHEVQKYIDYVRDVVESTKGTCRIEQRLSISPFTNEENAFGTADVVILAEKELIVIDLKYGRGVPVQADHNPQLQIYALAALEEYNLAGDIEQVRMVIHQPRLNTVSEWVQSVDELSHFAVDVAKAALLTQDIKAALVPGDKACQWCRAKAQCPALRDHALDAFENLVPDELNDGLLSQLLSQADMFEGWIKSIRAEAETRLLDGNTLPNYKLVLGNKGARAWTDKAEAESLMKSMRLKVEEMYTLTLITPTAADKLSKLYTIGPRQWPKLQALITQPPAKPVVVEESDRRPAHVPMPDSYSPTN